MLLEIALVMSFLWTIVTAGITGMTDFFVNFLSLVTQTLVDGAVSRRISSSEIGHHRVCLVELALLTSGASRSTGWLSSATEMSSTVLPVHFGRGGRSWFHKKWSI